MVVNEAHVVRGGHVVHACRFWWDVVVAHDTGGRGAQHVPCDLCDQALAHQPLPFHYTS